MSFVYYYLQLNDTEKAVYDDFLTQVFDRKAVFTVHYDVSDDRITAAYLALLNDRPEVYFIPQDFVAIPDINHRYDDAPPKLERNNDYRISQEECVSADEKFSELIEKINENCQSRTTYDVALYAAKLIVENCSYIQSFNDMRYQSAASVVLDRKSACAGLSKAYKLLLDKLGIQCIIVNGESSRGVYSVADTSDIPGRINLWQYNEGHENYYVSEGHTIAYYPHAWNMVNFDGKWLHVDVTSMIAVNGRNLSSRDYFAVGDAAIRHNIWNKKLVPATWDGQI